MKPELLAPAGDIEAAYAALFYGANALYLGLRQFSARATATNFTPDELCEITGYAHSKGAKIYVTVNTLVQNAELESLTHTLDVCVRAGVDAVIIQDLGVARVIKEKYPELEMHASTQMAVHNLEGALALQKLGFTRVVLAREMDKTEIEKVASVRGLETEAFIHGALCYAYSGLCLFSSMETGMSANRGKCLYPCRACFGGDLGDKHLFSMKDMALQEDALKMPVTSLKIEGRKKTALYVAAVTNYYRRLLDGKPVDNLADDIRQIFARPWTKLHFNGKNKDVIDTDFVGHRGLKIGTVKQVVRGVLTFKTSAAIARYDGIQIDVAGEEKPFGFSLEKMRVNSRSVFEAAAGETVEISLPPKAPFIGSGAPVYLASSSRVKGSYHYDKPKAGSFAHRDAVDVSVTIGKNTVTAISGAWHARQVGAFEPARDVEKVSAAVRQAFEKVGDTALSLGTLTVENPQGLFVPASVLNELRRELYAQIVVTQEARDLPEVQSVDHAFKGYILKADKIDALGQIDLSDVAEIIVAVAPDTELSSLQKLPKNKVRLALPTVCRTPKIYAPFIQKALDGGYKKWEIGHVWGLELLPSKGIDLSLDSSIYMMNVQASEMARDMGASRITLSLEDTPENLHAEAIRSALPTVFVAYADVPLFVSANCIRPHDCKHCKGGTQVFHLTKGVEKYEAYSTPCQTMVLNERALCLADKAADVGADYVRVDFMYRTYSPAQAAAVFAAVKEGRNPKGTHKGNFERRI